MVIPTPEIIQPRLFVVHITAITEGIELAKIVLHAASRFERLTPRIVLIFYNNAACAVKNGHNVALQILHIAVRGTVINDYRRLVLRIVEEVQLVAALGHVHNVFAMQRVVMVLESKRKGHPAMPDGQ